MNPFRLRPPGNQSIQEMRTFFILRIMYIHQRIIIFIGQLKTFGMLWCHLNPAIRYSRLL